jgi:hypothetical protein
MISDKAIRDFSCQKTSTKTRVDAAQHPLLRLFARSAPMAKGKKKTNTGIMAASKPASRVTPASSTVKLQQVVAVEQHAECHVNVAMSPAKSATDAVEMKLTYSEEQAVPTAAAQDVPAAPAAVAPCAPPPATEPAVPPTVVVTANGNTISSKEPAAPVPTATAAVVKSSLLPPAVVTNLGRYFNLAVQAYTFPVRSRLISTRCCCIQPACSLLHKMFGAQRGIILPAGQDEEHPASAAATYIQPTKEQQAMALALLHFAGTPP